MSSAVPVCVACSQQTLRAQAAQRAEPTNEAPDSRDLQPGGKADRYAAMGQSRAPIRVGFIAYDDVARMVVADPGRAAVVIDWYRKSRAIELILLGPEGNYGPFKLPGFLARARVEEQVIAARNASDAHPTPHGVTTVDEVLQLDLATAGIRAAEPEALGSRWVLTELETDAALQLSDLASFAAVAEPLSNAPVVAGGGLSWCVGRVLYHGARLALLLRTELAALLTGVALELVLGPMTRALDRAAGFMCALQSGNPLVVYGRPYCAYGSEVRPFLRALRASAEPPLGSDCDPSLRAILLP